MLVLGCLGSGVLFIGMLSGPEIARYRETISAIPPYCALWVFAKLVSQHGQLGAIPPPPFLRVSHLESMRSGGAIPSLKRGISAILARYPMKIRQMGVIPPSAILSRKGVARYGGGILHWAAKLACRACLLQKCPRLNPHLILKHYHRGQNDYKTPLYKILLRGNLLSGAQKA